MKRVNLSGDLGGPAASSGFTPRARRLLILLLIVIVLGAGAFAAQKFLLQEKTPAPVPVRPLAQAPPPIPKPSIKPPETVQPAAVVPPVAAPPSIATPSQARKEAKLEKPLESEPIPPEAEKRRTPAQHRYSLQVASCVVEKNALSLTKTLQAEGFSPRIVKAKAALTKHSVYLGDFSSPVEANEMGDRLQADGIRAALKPMEKGHYSYLISSSFILNEAIDTAHELLKKNYAARIRSAQVQTPVYQVLVGRFADRTQTAKPIERLRGMGYSPILVRE